MHPQQSTIGDPKVSVQKASDRAATLTMGPIPQGFGQTIGNAFRRVLLSSIEGAAITAAKIDGFSHEYATKNGIAQSGVEILLNLKAIRVRKTSSGAATLKLAVKGQKLVTAADFEKTAGVEIINPDAVIAELVDAKAALTIEATVETGIGYSLAGNHKTPGAEWMAVNALFSPIEKCAFDVEPTRAGSHTELDKLVVSIETDGTVKADDAFASAANLLRYYFGLIDRASTEEVDAAVAATQITGVAPAASGNAPVLGGSRFTPVETLQLSPRTLNSLLNGGIETVERLMQTSKKQLTDLKGFGKKAMDEIADALAARSLSLSER